MPRTTAEDGSVKVHGQRLHFSIRPGLGPPLLLINGFVAGMGVWDHLRAGLEMESVAFDLPGSGRSRPSLVPYPMHLTARLVTRLLDQLGFETVDVLGVSLGGGIAQQLALLAPGRVRRLVLAATNFGIGSIPGNVAGLLALFTPQTLASPWIARLQSRAYGGQARHDPGSLSAFEHSAFPRPPSLRSRLWQLATALSWCSLPTLSLLRQPTLVLAGDDDRIVPVLNARIIAMLIPRARLHVLRDAGHLFVFERAEETAELVNRFLLSPEAGASLGPLA